MKKANTRARIIAYKTAAGQSANAIKKQHFGKGGTAQHRQRTIGLCGRTPRPQALGPRPRLPHGAQRRALFVNFFAFGCSVNAILAPSHPNKSAFRSGIICKKSKIWLNTKHERKLKRSTATTLFTPPRPRVLLTMHRALRCFLSLHFCVAEFNP